MIAGILAVSLVLAPVPSASAEKGDTVKFQDVTVRPGETLWKISEQYLKDPQQWAEIVRYNKMPSSDPTVALPGMVLRVPVALIKEELRAAILVQKLNKVLARRRASADWKSAELRMPLYRDDGLQTLRDSKAQVQFVNGEVLSLDENSMAILKPRKRDDADLELQKGQIATQRSRVVTVSARITPQTPDTKYTATLRDDMSTRVAVLTGKTEVEGAGKKVMVKAGYQTDVAPMQAPAPPKAIPNLPEFEARFKDLAMVEAPQARGPAVLAAPQPKGDAADFRKQLSAATMGVPVSAYHVQVSAAKDFARIAFDKNFEADERIDLLAAGLPPGAYWWRVAIVDLLGVEGRFGAPRQITIGSAR